MMQRVPCSSTISNDSFDMDWQSKLKKGKTAYIDERYRTKSFISGKLVEVMEKCWAYDPKDRIDIFEAVRMLREISEEHAKRKQHDRQEK